MFRSQASIWAYRALAALLMAWHALHLAPPQSRRGEAGGRSAPPAALELADETAAHDFRLERDYVRAHWLLGAALRAA